MQHPQRETYPQHLHVNMIMIYRTLLLSDDQSFIGHVPDKPNWIYARSHAKLIEKMERALQSVHIPC